MIAQTQVGAEAVADHRDLAYLSITKAAARASGSHASLRLRARSYLNLYRDSNGACCFALIAAHGALWAAWYLLAAKFAALLLALLDFSSPLPAKEKYRQFSAYVRALKDINQLVMVESFILIHTIKDLGAEFAVSKGCPKDLAFDYARAMNNPASEFQLRDLYHRHFLWEQERVVSGKLDEAFSAFAWPLMRQLSERPWVWFSYFGVGKSMNFKQFTDQAERVEKGLIAFDRAVAFGLDRVSAITDLRLKIFPGTKTLGV